MCCCCDSSTFLGILNFAPAGGRDRVTNGAAYLSWGHLTRRVACDLLDVEPNELDINIRPIPSEQGGFYEVFLMDTLENGAGYCTYLAQLERIRDELLQALIPGGSLYSRLWHTLVDAIAPADDCLRDYSNAEVHTLLDGAWQLTWLSYRHLFQPMNKLCLLTQITGTELVNRRQRVWQEESPTGKLRELVQYGRWCHHPD